MSILHNAQADFAASELARMFVADPSLCYDAALVPAGLSTTATYEPSASPWPKADGLITILEAGTQAQRDIAIEYKRTQEGIHGLLTAIGQSQGYLHKGYNGAAIVIPSHYASHDRPGAYVSEVLERQGGASAIGVFAYESPDVASASPFAGRLRCERPIRVSQQPSHVGAAAARPKTQWVHMREGSTTRDAFYRFLQLAKRLSAAEDNPAPYIPNGLREAIGRTAPGRDPAHYLANTSDDRLLTRVWRAFWFGWILTPEVIHPWRKEGMVYVEPNAFTRIRKDDDTGFSQIFEGRNGSLKSLIVAQLNNGAITEDVAWEQFANGIEQPDRQNKQGVRERAHSYREDIDSSLAQLKWIDPDGHPTDCGYRYISLCERYGGANSRAAREYLGATLLQAGHYGAFLHYIYRLSEEKFSRNPLEFTEATMTGPIFNEASYTSYLAYLEDRMADELRVMRKVAGRDRPRRRTTFQAELTLLRNYGFVSSARYRLGVGIPIDWEKVHEAMTIEL